MGSVESNRIVSVLSASEDVKLTHASPIEVACSPRKTSVHVQRVIVKWCCAHTA